MEEKQEKQEKKKLKIFGDPVVECDF